MVELPGEYMWETVIFLVRGASQEPLPGGPTQPRVSVVSGLFLSVHGRHLLVILQGTHKWQLFTFQRLETAGSNCQW